MTSIEIDTVLWQDFEELAAKRNVKSTKPTTAIGRVERMIRTEVQNAKRIEQMILKTKTDMVNDPKYREMITAARARENKK